MYWAFVFTVLCFSVYGTAAEGEQGSGMFEGDMILSPEQMAAVDEQDKQGNQFASIKSSHWKTNGKADTITYYITKDLTKIGYAAETIRRAIAAYHKDTCIRFKEVHKMPKSGTYMYFVLEDGCFSNVGRLSWGNKISLGYGCWHIGTAMHEIGHALGFFHEQSRPDRDQYVEIMWNNIESAAKHNFNKYRTDTIDSLDTEYDYDSMMHYKNNYFAIDRRQYTIKTKDPSKRRTIGQRDGFSRIDKIQINRMYCGTKDTDGYIRPATLQPVTTPVPTTLGCVDIQTRKLCDTWANDCGRWYVAKHCKKSCGLCTGETTNLLVTTPATEVTKPTPGSNCKDMNTSCPSWKNYCNSNTYVQQNCLKTCGRC